MNIFLFSVVSGCVSISAFTSLIGILIGITSSAVGLKFMQSLQELKSINELSRKKIEKKNNKIVLLAKTKLNSMAILTSKALIDSYKTKLKNL